MAVTGYDQVKNLLYYLPEDPDDIALFFKERGIKGVPGIASECVISEYIKGETNNKNVCTSNACVYILNPNDKTLNRLNAIPLTENQQKFLALFDGYTYPELVTKRKKV